MKYELNLSEFEEENFYTVDKWLSSIVPQHYNKFVENVFKKLEKKHDKIYPIMIDGWKGFIINDVYVLCKSVIGEKRIHFYTESKLYDHTTKTFFDFDAEKRLQFQLIERKERYDED